MTRKDITQIYSSQMFLDVIFGISHAESFMRNWMAHKFKN